MRTLLPIVAVCAAAKTPSVSDALVDGATLVLNSDWEGWREARAEREPRVGRTRDGTRRSRLTTTTTTTTVSPFGGFLGRSLRAAGPAEGRGRYDAYMRDVYGVGSAVHVSNPFEVELDPLSPSSTGVRRVPLGAEGGRIPFVGNPEGGRTPLGGTSEGGRIPFGGGSRPPTLEPRRCRNALLNNLDEAVDELGAALAARSLDGVPGLPALWARFDGLVDQLVEYRDDLELKLAPWIGGGVGEASGGVAGMGAVTAEEADSGTITPDDLNATALPTDNATIESNAHGIIQQDAPMTIPPYQQPQVDPMPQTAGAFLDLSQGRNGGVPAQRYLREKRKKATKPIGTFPSLNVQRDAAEKPEPEPEPSGKASLAQLLKLGDPTVRNYARFARTRGRALNGSLRQAYQDTMNVIEEYDI